MIQLKKRVARLKIEHFLKKNKLVLFFHYNLNQNNTKNKSLCDVQAQLLSLRQGSVFLKKNRIAQTLSTKRDFKNTSLSCAQLKHQTALFQGPAALLGIRSVNQLHEILKLYKQQDVLVLLGGIYNNQPINCVQVAKLNRLSQTEQIFSDLHLIRYIKRPVLQILLTFSAHPLYSILDKAQYRLVEVFNWRANQLSTFTNGKAEKNMSNIKII